MKNIFVIIAAMFLSSAVYAQVHFNVNLGGQTSWGHPGYNSHRVIIYHRLPVRPYVIYRNENPYGYESYPLQKHDNGKHKGWYKGNNGNSYGNPNGNGDVRRNDDNYYNDNGSGNYNGNDNGNNRSHDNSYYNNDNGNSNGNTIENKNDEVPDKYKR